MLASCAVGPDYIQPTAPVPLDYKELPGWKIAAPGDEADRGDWWSIYNDPTLNSLMWEVEISNQNIASAEAAFRKSVTLVQQGRASLFPTIGLNYAPTRWGEGPAAGNTIDDSTGSTTKKETTYTLDTTASWDFDVWGKIRRTIESDAANAQASAADLASAKLLAQAQLAAAYFNLRASDTLHVLLRETVAGYKETTEIAEAKYRQGTVSKYDVVTAKTQLRTAQALEINVGVQRAQYEHAIAVLIGRPPSEFSLMPESLARDVPVPPLSVPSVLLERRPDIAAAERRIAGQNALIGVEVAAYFPDISLAGFGGGVLSYASYGFVGTSAFPVSIANQVWSFGVNTAQILFDGGLRRAEVASAVAAYYESVADYRQTILSAFQQVEDQLSSLRILAEQAYVLDDAVRLSDEALDITLAEYRAGTIGFTAVVQAQEILLTNEQKALTTRQEQFLASVNLVKALGGGWDSSELPTWEELRHWRACITVRQVLRGPMDEQLPPCL